ncbi:MAG: hypothetical protein IPG58_16480 [Acidobacteria bacterium]|nr:hypothetical protein [Acidobacteriota bacterium]
MSKKTTESIPIAPQPWPPVKPKSGTKVRFITAIISLTMIATLSIGANAASVSFLDSVKSFFGMEISQTAPAAPFADSFTITPTNYSVQEGSTTTFTWTFTADNSNADSVLDFTIPNTWTAPTGNVTVSHVSCSGGAQVNTIVGQVVTVGFLFCNTGQSFTLAYTGTAPNPGVASQNYVFTNSKGSDPSVTANGATVALSDLTHTYDGTPKSATATTDPALLTVGFIYTGVGPTTYGPTATAPTDAGTYSVTGTINNPPYFAATDTGPFTINPRRRRRL